MGKIIRFYASSKPDKQMDMLTIEDLREQGFVPLKYKSGPKNPVTLQFPTEQDPARLVHESVPVYSSKAASNEHPIVNHEIGRGWGADWGAMRFDFKNEQQLHGFMRLFGYSVLTPQAGN